MLSPLVSRLRACLFWTVLAACWAGALCDTCNPGVLSPGWIYPPNDLFVETGKSWEMLCVLNTSHPDGQGGTWRNLSFYIDNALVEAPLVTRYNETAIQLRIDDAQLSNNSPPDDYYVVMCRQNKERGICSRHVYVGYPPEPVTDFQCLSYNWERLECTWMEPYNPIQTAYALSYQLVLRARQTYRAAIKCPSAQRTFLNSSRRQAASASASPAEPGSCTWSEASSPPYMPTARALNFTMNITNELGGPRVQYLGLVDNYAIVIPGEMRELRVNATTASSATVDWKVPFNLQLFPPGLEFRIAYRILSSWADSVEYHNVPEAAQIAWNSTGVGYRFEVALPYAYADYNVSVWARSRVANRSDEKMWSNPATVTLRTDSDRPCSSPNTTTGAFEVIGTRMDERTVTVRWSRLPPQCENGPAASYSVVLHDAGGNAIDEKNVTASATHVQFGGLAREKAFGFKILAFNEAWYSSNYSQLYLPMSSKMPTPPENVMRISYNATFFEIQWTRSLPSQSVSMSAFRSDDAFHYPPNVTDYTVFWCQSERDSPVECKGTLYWETVPASQLALNVTVRTAENYQFAVAANQGSVSSGLVWSTCIVSADGNGSQIKQVDVVSATNSSLDLAWSLPCSVQNGIVTGFKIYYCPVPVDNYYDNEVPDCRDGDGEYDEREVGPDVNRYRLDGLEAYTMYKIVMSVKTRLGEGQSSAPVLNRTAEGRPSAPLDLRAVDVTNQTVTLAWRRPDLPNGPAPYYVVLGVDSYVQVSPPLLEYTVTDLQCYTDYVIRLRACNSPDLCSDESLPLPVKTKIGTPSEPILTTVKPNADNSSLLEIKWQHPLKPAGPISMTLIKMASNDVEEFYITEGNTTERLVDAASMCQPGQSLKIRLQAANRDDGVELYGPWSPEVEYPCLREGLSAAQIAGISFGAAVLVLLVVGAVLAGRRVQTLRTKAEKTEIILPWEKSGNMGGGGGGAAEMASPGGIKQVVQKDANSIGGRSYGSGKANNFYGRLGGAPAVITFKKQQSTDHHRDATQQQQPTTDGEFTGDRESRSSGHSSAPDSLSWHRASRSELSSSDSGAEFEATNSPSPDALISSPPMDAFAKPMTRSSQNLPEAVTEFSVFPAVQMRDGHGSSAPDLAQSGAVNATAAVTAAAAAAATPYVRVGTVTSPGVAPSPSVGYVTLGQSQPAESAASSPNASPNLSVGSNESLIGKSERDVRPAVKIVPLKRNSAGGSGGYVDACIVEPVCELRASASPGYVSFKSQEPVEVDRTASVGPIGAPSTNGYVTLGANSAGAAPGATSTHYVKMGPQTNHSPSYV